MLHGDILVIGGADDEAKSVERFNTSLNTWSVIESLTVDVDWGQAGTLRNNVVYVIDSNSGTIYTTNDLKTWNETVISNLNSLWRETFPGPIFPASMINC